MDPVRAFLLATALALPLLSVPTLPAALAQERTTAFTTAELMQAAGLDDVFTQFGAAIAASPHTQQITGDAIFIHHWEAAAKAVFDADAMHNRLAAALDGRFSDADRQVLADFFRSEFGRRITALERRTNLLPPEAQSGAIAEGRALVAGASETRAVQLDEIMQLVSTEISGAMVAQSMRAMLLGMSVSNQHGDVKVPWEEIDAQVNAMLPGLRADVAVSQRAVLAFTYQGLSATELERYIVFLRKPAAQEFYATIAYEVGRIVADQMSVFGEAFAARMASVAI